MYNNPLPFPPMRFLVLALVGHLSFTAFAPAAEILATWKLHGRDLSGPLVSDFGSVPGVISRGPSLKTDLSIINGYGSTGWSKSASFPGKANGSYYSIKLSIDPMHSVDLASISLSYSSPAGTNRVTAVELRSSVDSFGKTLLVDSVGFSGDRNTVVLTNLVRLTGTIEFRLWGFAAASTNALFLLDNDNAFPFPGSTHAAVRIEGTLKPLAGSPVPVNIAPAVLISWPSIQGLWYQIQFAAQVAPADWANIGSPRLGTGTTMSVFDATGSRPLGVYRVVPLQ